MLTYLLPTNRRCGRILARKALSTVALPLLVMAGCSVGGKYGLETSAGPPPLPSRMFAGPTQYPPREFAAYGIVAFPTLAMSDDIARYQMICKAYVASLPFYKEIPVPIHNQMVTVWPIENDIVANQINAMPRDDKLCEEAVRAYDLVTALNAIGDARRDHAKLDGLGPFLLAWSPSGQMGKPDALVLVLNLSNVTNSQQVKERFVLWSKEIVQNPALWTGGWQVGKVKLLIQAFVDKYGPSALELFNLASR